MIPHYALAATTIATILSPTFAQFLTDSDDDYLYTTTTSRRPSPTSAFWTYTSRFVDQVSESPYTYYNGEVTTDTWTTTAVIKDGVTPTQTPYSLYTSSHDYYYSDLQIVEAYYATGAVAASDIVPEKTYDYYSTATTSAPAKTVTSIEFSMPVTMTAPASCPTPFTVTTSASVDIPSQVTAQVSPTSVETSSSGISYSDVVYMYETWYLSANAAPFTSTSDYYYSRYIADCSTPPAPLRTGSTHSNGGSSSNNGDSSSDYDGCYSYYYCHTSIWTWVIIIATVIPGLFLLGFLESFFWFRRLMRGKSAMRCGTICWVLISLWILCFTRMQDRRSAEDQKLLAEKWKGMGGGAKFKAWLKWGFRHRYPEVLLGQFCKTTVGIVPPGQPLHPAMAQMPGAAPNMPGQVYYYGPPPPGWVQAPNGGLVPPQGYVYPSPQQTGYYGGAAKDGPVVSQYSVPMMGNTPQQQQMGNPAPVSPQAPQPVHPAQNSASMPTHSGAPPTSGPTPAPSAPSQASAPSPPPQAAGQGAPQIPPIRINDSPVADTSRNTPSAPVPPPSKDESRDRDLYE